MNIQLFSCSFKLSGEKAAAFNATDGGVTVPGIVDRLAMPGHVDRATTDNKAN